MEMAMFGENMREAIKFWKAAEIIDEAKEKEEYERDLKNLSLPSTGLQYIEEFIEQFRRQPYFDKDKVFIVYADKVIGHMANFDAMRDYLSDNDDDLVEYVIDRFLDLPDTILNDEEYLRLEVSGFLKDNYVRKAQEKVVKYILSQDRVEHSHYGTDVADDLGNLWRHSKKFDKKFLERLIKHFGPETYAEVMANEMQPDKQFRDTLNKKTLNIYDIASLLKTLDRGHFRKDEFISMLKKADDRAKEYLRTFLYNGGGENYFMLDEEMKPIDKEYKQISIPSLIRPIFNWRDLSQARQKQWHQIFNEFQIIPYVGGNL